jgi:CheY-like chemotaxis protein
MAHKLLLADDSVTIQRVIELTFADEDIEVTTVADGQMAIDRLDLEPPDIVLADVDMPRRDGYEVAAYVKSRPKLAHIPVVLLTGAFEPIDPARAAASGSSDVLAKPFEPQMVINRVKELLGKKRRDEVKPADATLPSDATPPPPQPAHMMTDNSVPGPHPAIGENRAISLDEYFDQLDAAFSNLHPGTALSANTQVEADWLEVVSQREASASAKEAPVAPSNGGVAATAISTVPVVPPTVAAVPAVAPGGVTADKWVAADAPALASISSAPDTAVPADKSAASGVVADGAVASALPFAPVADSPVTPATSSHVSAPGATAGETTALHEPFLPVGLDTPAFASVSNMPDAAASTPGAAAAPLAPAAPRTPTNPFATLSAARAEAARPKITEELIEEVIARVLKRMTDDLVRQTVTDIVSQTAERLVQEEIERIKSSGTED